MKFFSAVPAPYTEIKSPPTDYQELYNIFEQGKDFKILQGSYFSFRDIEFILSRYDYFILCYKAIRCKVQFGQDSNIKISDASPL